MNRLTVCCVSLLFAMRAATAAAAIPQPLFPGGIINDRTPTFTWTSTGASQYTVELTVDNSAQQQTTVASPRMKRSAPLTAGVYRWRVKEGNVASTAPWSAARSFTILPYSPSPLTPDYLLTPPPVAPDFTWDNDDPLANLYAVQLFKNDELIDSVSVTGSPTGPASFHYPWPDLLPAGSYQWRMRSIRKHADAAFTIKSGWTGFHDFSVGVPTQTRINKPTAGTNAPPGTYILPLEWFRAGGATSYFARVLCNGEEVAAWPNWPTNLIKANRTWTPGHHVLLVRAVNSYGTGIWSEPRSFLVTRNMTPGDDHLYLGSTNRLSWVRSGNATRYRVRLFRVNPATGEYALLKEGSVPQPVGQPFWNPGTLTSGAYRWQVTDFNGDKALYTSTAYFSIDVPPRPVARTPRNPTTGLCEVDFVWEQTGFSTHFQFQLLKNGVPIKDTGWKTPAELNKGPPLLTKTCSFNASGPGVYHWRVRAKNGAGTGGWRDTQVTFASLPALVIKKPLNNSSYPTGTSISIQWKTVPGNVRYHIQFWNNGTLKKEDWLLPHVTPTVSYTWKVGAGLWTVRVRALVNAYGPWKTCSITGTP